MYYSYTSYTIYPLKSVNWMFLIVPGVLSLFCRVIHNYLACYVFYLAPPLIPLPFNSSLAVDHLNLTSVFTPMFSCNLRMRVLPSLVDRTVFPSSPWTWCVSTWRTRRWDCSIRALCCIFARKLSRKKPGLSWLGLSTRKRGWGTRGRMTKCHLLGRSRGAFWWNYSRSRYVG